MKKVLYKHKEKKRREQRIRDNRKNDKREYNNMIRIESEDKRLIYTNCL